MHPALIAAMATFGVQKLRGKSTSRSLRDAVMAAGFTYGVGEIGTGIEALGSNTAAASQAESRSVGHSPAPQLVPRRPGPPPRRGGRSWRGPTRRSLSPSAGPWACASARPRGQPPRYRPCPAALP